LGIFPSFAANSSAVSVLAGMKYFNLILVVYMQIAGILAEQLVHQSSLAVDSKGVQMRSEANMVHTDGDSGKAPVVVPIKGTIMPVKQHVKVTQEEQHVKVTQEVSARQKNAPSNLCVGGNVSADGDVCCAAACTACNATMCDGPQSANCCPATIVEANVACGSAPCTLAKVTTEAPNTTTTASTTTPPPTTTTAPPTAAPTTVAPCVVVIAPPPIPEQIVETVYEEVSTSEEVKDGAQTQNSMSILGSIVLVFGSLYL